MSEERGWEKEAQHQFVTMQTATALSHMSPRTTRTPRLETSEDALRRGRRVNLSQSTRPVCWAHRQPGSLVGPTQLACTHLSDWYTNHCPLPHPPRIRASPFGRYGVIRLKVDVCTRCISASSWVTIFDRMLLTFG